jgi:hypothetical protein
MKPFCVWFVAPVLAAFALVSVATIARAQSTDERSVTERPLAERAAEPSKEAHTPMVTDWSHRHLVFSHAEARARSTSREDRRLQADRRFQQALARRSPAARSSASVPTVTDRRVTRTYPFAPRVPASDATMERDWTAALGQSADFGSIGNEQYPAKFQFNIDAPVGATGCTGPTSDFVVYNTNTVSFIAPTGSTGGGTIRDAREIGIFLGAPAAGFKITITPPGGTPVVFTAVGGTPGALQFSDTSLTAAATSLVTAINNYEAAQGGATGTFPYTATQLNFFGFIDFITITDIATSGADAGAAGNGTTAFPNGSFSSGFTFLGANFTGGSGGTGSTGAAANTANLVALNNLYTPTTCSGTGPLVMFAYAVSTASGATTTSPALSDDGTQIAVVESTGSCPPAASGCSSTLHLIKWSATTKPGTLAVPVTPTAVTAANYRACAAPCMTSIPISASASDTNSQPFVDYTNDDLYVGDDSGVLHQFVNVFLGSPAAGFNATVDAGFALTGPVFDAVSGNVYMADANGELSAVSAEPPAITTGNALFTGAAGTVWAHRNTGDSYPIPDPPIVDSSACVDETADGNLNGTNTCEGTVFIFVSNDGDVNAGPNSDVYQYTTDLVNSGGPVVGPAGVQIHDGDFDNNYYNGNYSSAYLYFCGKTSSGDIPAIQRIPFDSFGMLNPASLLGTASFAVGSQAGTECSPVTEVFNNGGSTTNTTTGTDYIFFSVQSAGIGSSCTEMGGTGVSNSNPGGGCVMSLVLPDSSTDSYTWPPSSVSNSIGEPGGSSGIIIDNVISTAGGSSIYFSPLGYVGPTPLGQAVSAVYSGSGANAIITYTFSGTPPVNVVAGSTLTTTGFAPAGYNVALAIKTEVTGSGTYAVTVTKGATSPGTETSLGNGAITAPITSNGTACPKNTGCAVKATQNGLD